MKKKNNNKNKNLKSSQTHHQKEINYTKKVIRNTKWARTHDQLCTIKHINNQNLWNPEAESYKNWRKQQGSEKEKKKKKSVMGGLRCSPTTLDPPEPSVMDDLLVVESSDWCGWDPIEVRGLLKRGRRERW